MPDPAEASIVVNTWVVPDGSQDDFVGELTALFERLRELDGFVDGQILEGVDPTRFVSCARMRSARDREVAYLDGEVQEIMRRIGGLAAVGPHAYSLAQRFAPSGRDPADG